MRVWFVTLVLLLVALAGCTGSDTGETETGGEIAGSETGSETGGEIAGSETGSARGSDTGSETGNSEAGGETGNVTGNGTVNETVPESVANLTLLVAGPFMAPADVVFNMTIEGFDDLSVVNWALDVDSDGTNETSGIGTPLEYTQTFADAGTFTATLYADDGGDVSMETAIFSIIGEAGYTPQDTITITGTMSPGILGGPFATVETFTVDYVATGMTVSMAYSDPLGDIDWEIEDPTGTIVADTAADGPEADVNVSNAMAGEWTITLLPFYSLNTAYTLTISFT